jgi:hypothetical protein
LKSWVMVLFLGLMLIITTIGNFSPASAEYDGWEYVGPGVDYKQFILDGPAVAHVARMNRENQDVIIESSIAQGRLVLGSETVSTMANRYNEAVNFWPSEEGEYGATNRVLVAINGFYIESWGSYTPQGGQTHSGWYSKWHGYLSPNDPWGWGFGWKYNRTAMIGECMAHLPSDKQIVSTDDPDNKRELHRINVARSTGNLILYTTQYNWRTPLSNNADVVDVLVEMESPVSIIPLGNYVKGIVKGKYEGRGGTNIPFDHVVLSVMGTSTNQEFLLGLEPGDEIRISQELNYNNSCSPVAWDWNKTYSSIEGHFYFLKDGIVNARLDHSNARIREPRTAIAFNDDYIYFIVVDGRQSGYSWGVTIGHLGNFALDPLTLGARFGISLDGGGSSTMVVNEKVVNRPSDRCYHLFLPLIADDSVKPPPPVFYDPPENFTSPQVGKCERRVGNGMMMVLVERNEPSTSFQEGEYLKTKGQTGLRLGPGSNFPIFQVIEKDTLLEVVKHSFGMDGIFAKGQYWWKVKTLNGMEGWLSEAALESPALSSSMRQR